MIKKLFMNVKERRILIKNKDPYMRFGLDSRFLDKKHKKMLIKILIDEFINKI